MFSLLGDLEMWLFTVMEGTILGLSEEDCFRPAHRAVQHVAVRGSLPMVLGHRVELYQ